MDKRDLAHRTIKIGFFTVLALAVAFGLLVAMILLEDEGFRGRMDHDDCFVYLNGEREEASLRAADCGEIREFVEESRNLLVLKRPASRKLPERYFFVDSIFFRKAGIVVMELGRIDDILWLRVFGDGDEDIYQYRSSEKVEELRRLRGDLIRKATIR